MTALATAKPNTGIRTTFERIWTALAQGFAAYVEARSRTAQIERLNAKSDAELAKLGIKRDEIPRYVFRDLFYC
ncbi:hypothetical protein CVM52_16870 [Pseudooceanicola lipolyticus]|uniref:DUF1127 domain-containing protein n=2 Tax=Pseudooceanicola TaxID=1679449 RepID=A0A2M8IY83_9RHOB|nr:hypothetical protein [Pseudooceanicola lipolyticus]PJE35490.1 hypothetical protein CVM52_16870 [Pseudooceanicola lipolyticus]